MNNIQDLVDKISKAKCNQEDLQNFNEDDLKQIATRDFFDKYYSIKSILKVIDDYKNGIIDIAFLTTWAICYNYILSVSYNEFKSDCMNIKDMIRNDILEELDSMSFIDDFISSDVEVNLDDYRDSFIELDQYYREVDKIKVYYTKVVSDDEKDYLMCFVKDYCKEFVLSYCTVFIESFVLDESIEGGKTKTDMIEIDYKKYKSLIKELIQKGYKKIDKTK